MQQIQQTLQTIQTTLGTQGTRLSSLTQQLQTLQTTANSIKNSLATVRKPRKFYLTGSPVDGAAASGACATGYHMASLWEIFDPSGLDYNTSLGMTLEDSAQGPPSFFHRLDPDRSRDRYRQ